MTLVLDAGAFIAVERGDPGMLALLKRELEAGEPPRTHGGVVVDFWRGGSGRQVGIARRRMRSRSSPSTWSLEGAPVFSSRHRERETSSTPAVVLLARDGDGNLTSDPDDLIPLALAAGTDIEIFNVSSASYSLAIATLAVTLILRTSFG